MKLKKALLLVLLFFSVVADAQLLYEISGRGARKKSYIFATNKYVNYDFLDTVPNLFKCFYKCDKVINAFALQDYDVRAALRNAALLPDSLALADYYTPTEIRQLNDATTITLGMTIEQLARLKPAYLTELYRTELMKKWLNYDEKCSMEPIFEYLAQKNNIPIHGLDNLAEVLYIAFDREPIQWQYQELLKITQFPEREVKLERIIREMYLMGRLNDIAFAVCAPDNQSTLSFSDYQTYKRRNAIWAKRLTPFLQDGNAFITLDALFLGGEDGLLAILRKDGYKVRPVNRHARAE